MWDNLNDPLTYLPLLVPNLVNLLFYTSFCLKWPASWHVFVKWTVLGPRCSKQWMLRLCVQTRLHIVMKFVRFIGFLHPRWLADYLTFRSGRLPASPWYCIYSGTRAGVLTLFRPVYSNSSLIKPRSGCCGLRSVQCTTFSVTYSLLWKLTFCLLFYFWNEPCCKSVFNKLNPHREHCTDAVVQAIVSINFSSISPR